MATFLPLAVCLAEAGGDQNDESEGEDTKLSSTPTSEAGNRGGYDCELVEPPPAAFQTECPICLHVLKEPCLISCPCGKKICRECVEQIKEYGKPCPLCNKTDFTFMRDYGLERFLKEREVWCSHNKDGCEWRGKLGEYEQHLNEDPSPENQLTGCQFVEVGCVHGCGERFQRRHIAFHQDEECPERPYSCEYCHEYESTFEDVTQDHYFDCEMYPVTCPNKCRGDIFKRQDMEKHVNECPLTEIHCPLHYAGCKERLPRKDMPDHMSDTVTHMTLLATVTQSMQQNIEDLKKENQELRHSLEEKQKATEKEVEILAQSLLKENLELRQITEEKEKENQELRQEVKELRTQKLGLPIEFRVNNSEGGVFLPSFFSHSHGYQMCIKVYPNGCGDGIGTHISIFTSLMRGPYDDHLKWPFRGEITVQIVNQAGDHSHFENTIPYNDDTPEVTADRVVGKERGGGLGFPEFLPLTDLEYNAKNKTQYLKDDIIIVRVVSVVITQ